MPRSACRSSPAAPVGQEDAQVGVISVAVGIDVARAVPTRAAPVAQKDTQIGLIDAAVAVEVALGRANAVLGGAEQDVVAEEEVQGVEVVQRVAQSEVGRSLRFVSGLPEHGSRSRSAICCHCDAAPAGPLLARPIPRDSTGDSSWLFPGRV